ncbi:lytic murein transglycosylase [Moraxella oblonga]|uniref:lytic murein transglycosylase n=1 Tax=Moraxella oblonga TaxID=200413 RepID=UPI00082FA01A|nr:lytic murein transglycosylase [Moraxella oblonga]
MSQPYQHTALRVGVTALVAGVLMSCGSAPRTNNQPTRVINANNPNPSVVIIHNQAGMPVQPVSTTINTTTSYHTPIAMPSMTATPTTPMQASTVPTHQYSSFNEWKNDFIRRAIASGYSSDSVNRLMNGVSLNSQVVALDKKQAEFSKMPWEYIEGAASTNRITQGRKQVSEYPSLLSRLEQQYGVPKQIVVAIWGLESSYGAGTGSMNLVDALSSLAYDGRRRAFAEGELLAMTQMIQRDDVARSELKGSWAGGMGHTQFIPSTWLQYGVDGNNDGRKNPWMVSDALSSTANYLANSGWVRGLEAYYEVRLPSNLNPQLIGQRLPLDTWRAYGVSPVGSEYMAGQALAELWLPAGINGPALLTTQNFEVIKVYNNSTNYALGVALLGKRINHQDGIVAGWPRQEKPLSTEQIKRLQQNLNQKGYNTGTPDGIAGANTRRAFARWQADNGRLPDGFITQNSARTLIQ